MFIVYLIAGYWAAGVVFFENKVVIHSFGQLFLKKVVLGALLGIFIIPIAIIKRLSNKR